MTNTVAAKPDDTNIVRTLHEQVLANPDAPALVTLRQRVTFGQLWRRSMAIATGLQRRGFAPGDRGIVMLPMSPDLYAVLVAIITSGGTAVFADPWVSVRQMAAFCAYAEPTAFIGTPKSHLLRLFEKTLRRVPLSVSTGRTFCRLPARYSLEEMVKENNLASEIVSVNTQQAALITFTTGSSGQPKGAERSHLFLSRQFEALQREVPVLAGSTDMTNFPIFALRNLGAGTATVIPEIDFRAIDKCRPLLLATQIVAGDVRTLTLSPPIISALASVVKKGEVTLDIKRIVTGGAVIEDDQIEQWVDAFPRAEIEILYGSTEAEPVAKISARERLSRKGDPGCCAGRICTVTRAAIIPIARGPLLWQDIELLPPSETGELIVTGEHVCQRYYKNPEAIKQNKIVDDQGTIWHRMGDTGFLDDEGYFHITGRVHSTIMREGKVLHAQAVEHRARAVLPEVGTVAALGVPEDTPDQRLVLVCCGGGNLSQEEAMERLAADGLEVDRVILDFGPLPLDPRHRSKIDYDALRSKVQR